VSANITTVKRLDRFALPSRAKVRVQWMLYALVHNIGNIAHYGASDGPPQPTLMPLDSLRHPYSLCEQQQQRGCRSNDFFYSRVVRFVFRRLIFRPRYFLSDSTTEVSTCLSGIRQYFLRSTSFSSSVTSSKPFFR